MYYSMYERPLYPSIAVRSFKGWHLLIDHWDVTSTYKKVSIQPCNKRVPVKLCNIEQLQTPHTILSDLFDKTTRNKVIV